MTIVYKLGGSLLDLPDLPERLRREFARADDRGSAEPDAGQVEPRRLIVVGGGEAADLVRAWDRIHRLGDDAAHLLALEAMRLNERLVATLHPGSILVDSRSAAEAAWSRGLLPILSSAEFLAREERTLDAAPLVRSPNARPREDERPMRIHRRGPNTQLRSVRRRSDAGVRTTVTTQSPLAEPGVDAALPRTWDVTSDSIAAWIAARWPADELVLLKSTSEDGVAPINGADDRAEAARTPLVDPCFAALAARIPRVRIVDLRSARK